MAEIRKPQLAEKPANKAAEISPPIDKVGRVAQQEACSTIIGFDNWSGIKTGLLFYRQPSAPAYLIETANGAKSA